MRTLSFMFLTLSLGTAVVAHASKQRAKYARPQFVAQSADDLFYNLHGELTRQLGPEKVEFKRDAKGILLVTHRGVEAYRIAVPFCLEGVVQSDDRQVMLLLLTRGDTHAPFYHGIVRLRFDAHRRIEARTLMRGDLHRFNPSGVWVQELGAVSNDGRIALLQLSRPHRIPNKSDLFFYEWQTWDMEAQKKIGDGLRLCNAKYQMVESVRL